AQLNELREQKAPWTPVPGEKPRLKDLVHVTIATREGGEAKDPQPYQLVLGEGRAIPEVEERIMGLLPGETVDATVRFPSDFPEEAKRGQSRDVRITLHEVKRQQLPELDDAFAREVGDFESLEAMRRSSSGLRSSPRGAGHRSRSSVPPSRKPSGCAIWSAASPRRRCSPFSFRNPPWSRRDHQSAVSALHHRALESGRAHLRYFQPAAHGPHRVPGHADQ